MNVNFRLREERIRLGMNQTEFASLAGVTQTTQTNYETGKRNPDTVYLAAIAAAGADIQYIITGVRSCSVSALRPDEAGLLDDYRHSDEAGKQLIIHTGRTLARVKKAG